MLKCTIYQNVCFNVVGTHNAFKSNPSIMVSVHFWSVVCCHLLVSSWLNRYAWKYLRWPLMLKQTSWLWIKNINLGCICFSCCMFFMFFEMNIKSCHLRLLKTENIKISFRGRYYSLIKDRVSPLVLLTDTNQAPHEHSWQGLSLRSSQLCRASQSFLVVLAQTPVNPSVPSLLPASDCAMPEMRLWG